MQYSLNIMENTQFGENIYLSLVEQIFEYLLLKILLMFKKVTKMAGPIFEKLSEAIVGDNVG